MLMRPSALGQRKDGMSEIVSNSSYIFAISAENTRIDPVTKIPSRVLIVAPHAKIVK